MRKSQSRVLIKIHIKNKLHNTIIILVSNALYLIIITTK